MRPDFVSQPSRRGAALDAERERRSGLFRRRGPGEGAGDRVVAQRGEQLAGDEGPERDNALAFDPRPFRMRARQHDEPRSGVCDAEDFRLLPPHHIRARIIRVGQARREDDAPSVGLDRGQTLRHVARSGGAGA